MLTSDAVAALPLQWMLCTCLTQSQWPLLSLAGVAESRQSQQTAAFLGQLSKQVERQPDE